MNGENATHSYSLHPFSGNTSDRFIVRNRSKPLAPARCVFSSLILTVADRVSVAKKEKLFVPVRELQKSGLCLRGGPLNPHRLTTFS